MRAGVKGLSENIPCARGRALLDPPHSIRMARAKVSVGALDGANRFAASRSHAGAPPKLRKRVVDEDDALSGRHQDALRCKPTAVPRTEVAPAVDGAARIAATLAANVAET